MDILNKLDFSLIARVCNSRPQADHTVEQYLMTTESMYTQLNICRDFFVDKRVVFLGDDDHLSIIASKLFNTNSTVIEIDPRIIENQKHIEKDLRLKQHKTIPYDIRNSLEKLNLKKFDGFVVNPPYGSKNEAYGAKVWLSRALEILKPQSMGLLILPINFDLHWSIKNMLKVQEFLASNNSIVVKIDNDIHTYEDLPDLNLRSSNIWVHYLGNAKNLIPALAKNKNVYRI